MRLPGLHPPHVFPARMHGRYVPHVPQVPLYLFNPSYALSTLADNAQRVSAVELLVTSALPGAAAVVARDLRPLETPQVRAAMAQPVRKCHNTPVARQ